MYSSYVIFSVLCFVISGHCDTIAFHPGQTYSWIIPPRHSPPSQLPPTDFDNRNEPPIAPVGGYGHPPFRVRHSDEQLSLPNEFLLTPLNPNVNPQRNDDSSTGGLVLTHPPIFRQLVPQVDCDGQPTCPNVDITTPQHQQRATTIHQSNIASIPTITPTSLSGQSSYQNHRQVDIGTGAGSPARTGQPVSSWPSSGGIGLLFFAPESASHLPVEQLIRQQLVLHRTQLPFDISINCEHSVRVDSPGLGCPLLNGGSGGSGGSGGVFSRPVPLSFLPITRSLKDGGRNVAEKGNYVSPFEIANRRDRARPGSQEQQQQQRRWRTFGERIVRNKHYRNRDGDVQQQRQQISSISSE